MSSSYTEPNKLALQARLLFTDRACEVLPVIGKAVSERLVELVSKPGSARDMQYHRDAQLAYQAGSANWLNGLLAAWRSSGSSGGTLGAAPFSLDTTKFELVDNDVMDDQILASRLALRLLDFASWELNDLRLRIQHLDQVAELPKKDILRPEILARLVIEQWVAAKLPRPTWALVQDIVQNLLAEHLLVSYHAANEFLVINGVMAEIDLRPLVKRTPSALADKADEPKPGMGVRQNQSNAGRSALSSAAGSARPGAVGASRAIASYGAGGADQGRSVIRPVGDGGFANHATSAGAGGRSDNNANRSRQTDGTGYSRPASPQDETRMQTGTTPLARARMRAQGVMGTLKRLLSNQVAGFDDTRASRPSPQLAQAMSSSTRSVANSSGQTLQMDVPGQFYGTAHVEQAASAMRQRTAELKKAASTASEKATIEIVALMFQSILAEDRIPAAIRVWFARLQMPVLRLALGEPEFFGSLEHPARQLIDRMGSCVLGFNADVSGGALEVEVKRVVQVIEQYPETGRRVFQLVYDEFQKFLSKFLSENGNAARAVSVAQQMEQKETMAIQFTIEMRNMLKDIPVRDEIREFLYKVWAEALAISAMRSGPQHEETLVLKRASADLVWASSAKPNRADRAKVIAELPKLLQLLRSGMTMLGLDAATQDEHIKIISDTLADAFLSKNSAIDPARIDQMAKRLVNLEDYLSDEDIGDLPLDTDALVMMLGIDITDIEVVSDGGSQPSDAMRAWAGELQLGAWFSLDHNGRVAHVQFAWRSERKQLHLFASTDGKNYLIQARRLAAYLQAGLLVPTEEEALTVRATREALVKLEANPERLLG